MPGRVTLRAVIAIAGGLGAAFLWAAATLASSRSSRMVGSRVVLAWIMIVGTVVGIPIALATGAPREVGLDALALMLVAGLSYSIGLGLTYRALTVGKVSIVAPIVATEGALAAVIAIALGDPLALVSIAILAAIAVGVVLSSLEPARPDVPAGDIEITADAIEGPVPARGSYAASARPDRTDTRQAVALSVAAAAVFAVGIVAAGTAASLVAPIWVSLSSRLVGLVVVALPVLLQGRLRVTRAALPLVLLSGSAEIVGSTLSAWGATDSIAIAAVLGSQFAAVAAVAAFILFGERLSRSQTIGVVIIGAGVTVLAVVQA